MDARGTDTTSRIRLVIVLAMALSLVIASAALADEVRHDVRTSGGLQNNYFEKLGTKTVGYYVHATSGQHEPNGCNLSATNKATLNITVPTGVTADKTSLVFEACGVTQDVVFTETANAAYGTSYTISHSTTYSGSGSVVRPDDYTLIVRDMTGPVITMPANVDDTTTGTDKSLSGIAPTATDNVAVSRFECTADNSVTLTGGGPFAFTVVGGVATKSLSGTFPIGTTTITCTASDANGNAATPRSMTVTITQQSSDTTPPVITFDASSTGYAPNGSNGWWSSGTAKVKVTATDASGVTALECVLAGDAVTLTNQGSDAIRRWGDVEMSEDGSRTVSCGATDGTTPANTTATADRATHTLKRDTVAPAVACPTAPLFLLNQSPSLITAEATDAGSGPDLTAASDGRFYVSGTAATSVLGPFSGAPSETNSTPGLALAASDKAGHSTTSYCNFRVGGTWDTLNKNFDGSGVPRAKGGSTLPFQWKLKDSNGAEIALQAVKITSTTWSTCTDATGEAGAEVAESTAAGNSGLQRLEDGTYQVNWKTTSGWNTCRRVTLEVDAGALGKTSRSVNVSFFK